MLDSKGYTGFGNRGRGKGVIGNYNPAKLKGGAHKTYVPFLPEVGRKSWVTDMCPALLPLEPVLDHEMMMAQRGEEAPTRSPHGMQSYPGCATATMITIWLSALTSALRMAGRAWTPIEPRGDGANLATLGAAAMPSFMVRVTAIARAPPQQAGASRIPRLHTTFVK